MNYRIEKGMVHSISFLTLEEEWKKYEKKHGTRASTASEFIWFVKKTLLNFDISFEINYNVLIGLKDCIQSNKDQRMRLNG